MKKIVVLFLVLSSTWALAQDDARYEDLNRRIQELERQQDELLESGSRRRTQVHSFLRDNLTIGGFYESSLTAFDGEDTKFHLLNTSNILGINISADFNERIRFVSQILTGLTYPVQNQHNNPAITPASVSREREVNTPFFGALLTQGYLEYSINRNTRIQGGMGYVPFGYALQQRELVLFIRRNGPQVLRTTHLVSPLWSGVHLLGQYSLGRRNWGYNFYTTNPIDTNTTHVIGVGGRIWGSAFDDKLTAGLSAQSGKYGAHNDEIVGADILWKHSKGSVVSEFVQHMTEGQQDTWSAYLEPSLYIVGDELLLYVFGDYSYSTLPNTGTNVDPFQKWEYGTGLNWLPTTYTRLRLGLTQHDYVGNTSIVSGQNRDYWSVDTSIGVAF